MEPGLELADADLVLGLLDGDGRVRGPIWVDTLSPCAGLTSGSIPNDFQNCFRDSLAGGVLLRSYVDREDIRQRVRCEPCKDAGGSYRPGLRQRLHARVHQDGQQIRFGKQGQGLPD
jgi:hypothetical protein